MSPIEIQVEFESGDATTGIPSETPANGEWLTHPAFTLGDDELTGLWVAKFETSGTATQPLSKPSQITLVSQNVATQFTTGQQFGTTEYLTTTGVNEVDAHMARNMEWASVAYLKQSKYGLGNTEIMMNNYNQVAYNSSSQTGGTGFFTGCGSTTTTTATTTRCDASGNEYNTENGVKASTTGNITGVYDTSGGAWERVMGAMYASGNTAILYQNSGFNSSTLTPDSKYVDMYKYGTTFNDQAAYNRSHLGDATGEMRGWFSDLANFVYSSYAWFERGGRPSNGAGTGSFAFHHYGGGAHASISFRGVLARMAS